MTNSHDMYIPNGIIHVQYTWINVSFIQSHLLLFTMHKYTCTWLTWFNFNFLHQSLNLDPELYLNIHSGNLKNVLGQKDKQSCMHAFLQAVTAVKFPRKYSRQRDVIIITSTHVVSIIIRARIRVMGEPLAKEPTPTQDKVKPAEENVKRLRKEGGTKGNSKFRLISHDSCIT